MDFIDSSYCKLTQRLLSILGLWPYQSLWSRLIGIFFAIILMLTFFFAQVATIFTRTVTMAYWIDLLPTLVISILSIMMIVERCVKRDTMKQLLDTINDDWKTIVTTEEIEILRHYADVAKQLNLIYSTYTFIAMGSYSLSLFTSQILDIFAPLNETRPKEYPFYIETFVDDDKYFNEVLIIIIVVMYIVDIIIVSNQLLFMLYIHHICGMFTILGYRMDKTLQEKHLTTEHSNINQNYCMYRKIGTYIEDHLKATQLVQRCEIFQQYASKIDACYTIYYFIILFGGAVVASLFLVQVTSFSFKSDRLWRAAGFLIGQTVHMFLNSYMGQKLTDKSLSICQIIYNSKWHTQPPSLQKLLLLMMIKSSKPCIVSAFGIFILSFECFSTGVQTVVSYCMVIRQFQ